MDIKHPYTNTPYEILSDAEDPGIGILSYHTPRKNIRVQQVKVQRKGKRDAQEVAKAGTALLNTPVRMSHDAFLISTLSQAADVTDLIDQHTQPTPQPLPDILSLVRLAPILPELDTRIPILEVQVKRQATYDDPQSEIFAPSFDL